MEGKIRLRDPRWEEEHKTKRMLRSLQDLMNLQDLVDTDTFNPLIYFVLSLFPIEETATVNGNVTEKYMDFLEDMAGYSIQELYDAVMKGGGES